MIHKYNDFLLEKEYNSILNELDILLEDKWIDDNTYEWDLEDKNYISNILKIGKSTSDKLKKFLDKLPKRKIKEYYVKTINKFKNLPEKVRSKYIKYVTSIFISLVSLGYLTNSYDSYALSAEQVDEIETIMTPKLNIKDSKPIINKSSFLNAQKIVKVKEGGFSNDKKDTGNWVKLKGKDVFIGTNHGVAAPTLLDYYRKNNIKSTITKKDMIDLPYETAVKIFKQGYWDKNNLSEFENQSISDIIYDGCINQGNKAMKKIISNAALDQDLNIRPIDIFNVESIEKLNSLDSEELFNSIKKFRENRYKKSKTFKIHGKGWLDRLNSFKYK
jgi:lysozyme family protein